MMELTVKLNDKTFDFSYKVGDTSQHNGSMPLCADSLEGFVELMRMCHRIWRKDLNERMNDFTAKAFLQENPEVIEHYLNSPRGKDFLKNKK